LSIRPQVATLLGTFLPILEGLSMYAELDWAEPPGSIFLPHTVSAHSQIVTLAKGVSEHKMVLASRLEQIFEMPARDPETSKLFGNYGPGLLRLLFADTANVSNSFYLVGYLWIKSVAVILSRRNELFSQPTVLLPFLTRWFCHHPAVQSAFEGTLDAAGLARQLRDSVLTLEARLSHFASAVADGSLAADFDHWDLHGFLNSGSRDALLRPPQDHILPFFEGDEPSDAASEARASASIYFPGVAHGILRGVERTERRIKLVLSNAADGEAIQTHDIIPVEYYSDFLGFSDETIRKAMARQELTARTWESWVGQEILIASYLDFSRPLISGIVSWTAQLPRRPAYVPYEPAWYDDPYTPRSNGKAERLGLCAGPQQFSRTHSRTAAMAPSLQLAQTSL
jgi:hypothetical protein